MRAGLALAALLSAAGCVSERAGAPRDAAPPPSLTLREAVEAYGNPTLLRTLPDGGLEGVWPGTETSGWAFEVSVWGVRLLRVGRTGTQGGALRLRMGRTAWI